MPIKRGGNHGTHYLHEDLVFVDGVSTVNVEEFDNITVLAKGSATAEIRPSGWVVALPSQVSRKDDEVCIQADLRGVPSIDVVVVGENASGVLYAGLTGVDF